MRSAAIVGALLLATIAGCGGQTGEPVPTTGSPVPTIGSLPPTAGSPVNTFRNDLFSFEYPGTWNALVPGDDSTIVLLSSEPLADTEPRIDQLREDGAYIAWVLRPGAPIRTPDPTFTSTVTVGGRPTTITQAVADGDCESIGGGELLIARVDSPAGTDDVEMLACVRGPNVGLTGAAIAGMLASVSWEN